MAYQVPEPKFFACSNSKETEDLLDKVKEFINSLSNTTDGENQGLSEEVSTNQVQSNCQVRFAPSLKMLRKLHCHLNVSHQVEQTYQPHELWWCYKDLDLDIKIKIFTSYRWHKFGETDTLNILEFYFHHFNIKRPTVILQAAVLFFIVSSRPGQFPSHGSDPLDVGSVAPHGTWP